MSDTRHKNITWNLGSIELGSSWNQANAALLMDIRDELQTLNRLLACRNFSELPYNVRRTAVGIAGLRRDLKASHQSSIINRK